MAKATITTHDEYGYPVVTDDRRGCEIRTIRNMDDVRWFNNWNGYYFFEPDTMRFFSSRILETLYGGRYFVTSERNEMPYESTTYPRLYTVRRLMDDGTFETIGNFQQYETAYQAKKVAAALGAATLASVTGKVDA